MMKPKKTFHAHVFILLMIFPFAHTAIVCAQTGDKVEQIRTEVVKYHVKNKKSALQGIYMNLTMSALSIALGQKLKDKDEKRNLYYSGASSFFYALYNTWQVFNEAGIVKKIQRADLQNVDVGKMAQKLNKQLKWQNTMLILSLASSGFGVGINIYKANNLKLAAGKEDHKSELRGFYYLRSAVSAYSLYDGWKKLKETKSDRMKLQSLIQ